jgi:hypothetical protein
MTTLIGESRFCPFIVYFHMPLRRTAQLNHFYNWIVSCSGIAVFGLRINNSCSNPSKFDHHIDLAEVLGFFNHIGCNTLPADSNYFPNFWKATQVSKRTTGIAIVGCGYVADF